MNDEQRIITRVDSDSIQSWKPKNLYRRDSFQDTSNLTAESIASQNGNEVILAQIRDREKFHFHQHHDLLVTLLQGRGKLVTRQRPITLQKGDWVIIPRTVSHQFINTGTKPARAIVIRTPPPEERDYVLDEGGRSQ